MHQEELAARLKIDRSTIANLVRLLELPDEVLDALRSEKISAGHARALLPLGDEDQQAKFCQRICRDGLSVRATEESVQACILEEDATGLATPKKKRRRSGNDQLAQLAQTFRRVLGTKVDLRQTNQGRGRSLFTLPIMMNSNDCEIIFVSRKLPSRSEKLLS